jgi:hypothetical protein
MRFSLIRYRKVSIGVLGLIQLSISWQQILILFSVVLVTVLVPVVGLISMMFHYNSQQERNLRISARLLELEKNLSNKFSSQSENYSKLLQINDKITTMLGTKDPLAFQTVQATMQGADYTSVEYVDPSDEAEVRRLNDLAKPGNDSTEQDDELPIESIQTEWNSFDDPAYIARSIAEGT